MPPHRQSGGCWAWVLSPVPPPRLGPHESFVRLRLVGPDSLIDRTAQEFAALGGWASDSTPPSPPGHDGRQVVLAGTVAQLRQLAARGPAPAAEVLDAALTRADRAGRNAWSTDQTVDLATAIHAYTMGGAYANFLEADRGSISVGKQADLVALAEDLFAIEPAAYPDVGIDLVMVDGEAVVDRI